MLTDTIFDALTNIMHQKSKEETISQVRDGIANYSRPDFPINYPREVFEKLTQATDAWERDEIDSIDYMHKLGIASQMI